MPGVRLYLSTCSLTLAPGGPGAGGLRGRGSWSRLVSDLEQRGLASPVLIVSDGHRGLAKAIEAWPQAQVQRCAVHKWQNLVKHCPAHAQRELKRDYDRIVYAPQEEVAA